MAGSLLTPLLILLLSLALGSADREAQDIRERIINGVPCPKGSPPWEVALYTNSHFHCGGVLVTEMWVLTAAHCKMNESYVQVGGDWLNNGNVQSLKATESFVHPNYSTQTHINDIMLVKLSSPARLSSNVRKVNLPSCCEPPRTTCAVSGWGTTTSHKVTLPSELMYMDVTLISFEECKMALLKTFYNSMVKHSMICVSSTNSMSNACKGDSGGPLMCNDTLQGLVSWGTFPCVQHNQPVVYVCVCNYVGWIQDTMRKYH